MQHQFTCLIGATIAISMAVFVVIQFACDNEERFQKAAQAINKQYCKYDYVDPLSTIAEEKDTVRLVKESL